MVLGSDGHGAVELVAHVGRDAVRVGRALPAQSELAPAPFVALAQGVCASVCVRTQDLQNSFIHPSLQTHCDVMGFAPSN